jgi:hypothetical protein
MLLDRAYVAFLDYFQRASKTLTNGMILWGELVSDHDYHISTSENGWTDNEFLLPYIYQRVFKAAWLKYIIKRISELQNVIGTHF